MPKLVQTLIGTSDNSIRNLWNFVKDSTTPFQLGGSSAVDPQAAQESSSAATHRITIIFLVCIRKENI